MEKKSRAFLGYGSMEALAKALKPRPIPAEVGARLWKKIEQQIRQEEAATSDTAPTSEAEPQAPRVAPSVPRPTL